METIFDHNPTNEELLSLFQENKVLMNKKKYLETIVVASWRFMHISNLCELRNNDIEAEKYRKLSGFPSSQIIDYCY